MRLIPLPAFEDNYIWTLQDGDRMLVVDPGDAVPVLAVAERGIRPAAVLITHHHADHCGGIARLQEQWPALPVFAPEDPRLNFRHDAIGEGARFTIGRWELSVIAVPGHTSSHIAFVTGQYLFCGDTLFSLGCGRLFEGTPAQMFDSLQKLSRLPDRTLVCCAHEYTLSNATFAAAVDPDNVFLHQRILEAGDQRRAGQATLPVTLSSELASNPFLRCDSQAIRASVASRLGRDPADPLETFAELRRWKDGFRA
ncbi:MAG: hydroxyacylglutathione hydrolase [Xanthomonadaceae bacterium]|jgi:hydroxyacylglutathione hydrolase|nr:hydroxyacylglutathione hydrolase [Xanthomonadaceae bacterium]